MFEITSTQTFSPFVDSSLNNVLLQKNTNFNPLLLEFIHIFERRLIDPLLHDRPELVIDQIEVRAVRDHKSGEMKSVVSRCNSSIALRADALVRCTTETRLCHQRLAATRLMAGSTAVSK